MEKYINDYEIILKLSFYHSMVSYYHNMKKILEKIDYSWFPYLQQIEQRSEIMCWQECTPPTILGSSENQPMEKGAQRNPWD